MTEALESVATWTADELVIWPLCSREPAALKRRPNAGFGLPRRASVLPHPTLGMAMPQKVPRLSRREIRQDVRGRLMARLMDTDLALPVVDMSRGGFAVESPQPAVKGTVREMTFRTDENWCRLLSVRVTHCHALPPKLMRPGYRIGYQFVRPELAMATLTLARVLGPKPELDPWP